MPLHPASQAVAVKFMLRLNSTGLTTSCFFVEAGQSPNSTRAIHAWDCCGR